MPGNDLEVTTTQLFSRAALSSVRARSTEFDDNTQKMLTSLSNNRKRGALHGTQEITYKLSRSRAGQLGFGRLYGTKGSLEQLQSECRATLCAGIYHDLDIVNAQPTLLVQLVSKLLGRDMPSLEQYIDNRDSFLVQIMDSENCGRDDAKNAVISVLFGGSTKNETLVPLSVEIRTVAKQLCKLPEYAELFDSLKHEKNHYGSFLAHVTQTEERRCMLAMRDFMTKNGWSVDVLAYDGIMVRSRPDTVLNADLFSELELAVQAATGYTVRIIEKPLHGFDIQMIDDETEAAYIDMKAKFEETHFHFTHSNTIVQQTDEGLHHMGLQHAMDILNTWLLPTKNKRDEPELFIKKWLKDPKRRLVSKLVYKKPEDCEAHEASLFTAFAYKKMEGEDPTAVALFMDIVRCCAGDNEEVTDYLIKWLAHCIQRPFERPGTAIILATPTQGTGKDTLAYLIGRIIGLCHYRHYGTSSQFFDKYDTGLEGAVLAHVEECDAQTNKAHAPALKQKITGDYQTINPKGVKAYSVPNVTRVLMTSNDTDPVKLEVSERRFVIAKPSDRLQQMGLTWWNSIQGQLRSHAFMGTVGRMLENVDLTWWNPREMPMTECKEELMELSKANEVLFFESIIAMHKSKGMQACVMRPVDIYRDYKLWWNEQGMDPKAMAISPASLLKRSTHLQGKFFTKQRTADGYTYRLIL
jgi:hypothetical protein